MEAISPTAATPTTQGPDSAPKEATAPKAAEKVIFGGQEMDVDAFLKSRKHKVKTDGQELEVDFDELTRGYGHMSAANKRMQEAAAVNKQMQKLTEEIFGWKKSPEKAFEALEKMGIDLDSMAHDRVLKRMKIEMMTPEERNAYDMEQKLADYERQDQLRAEEKRQRELEELRQKAATDLENEILSILEANKDISPDPAVVGKALDYVISALNAGQDMPLDQAFRKAQDWYAREEKGIFERNFAKLLESDQLPDDLVKKVRQKDLAKLRQAPPKRPSETSTPQAKQAASVDDFFNNLDKRYQK